MDRIDFILLFVSTICSITTGLCIPAFNYLFGETLNKLNGNLDQFIHELNILCVYFVYLAIINLCSGFLQVFFSRFLFDFC